MTLAFDDLPGEPHGDDWPDSSSASDPDERRRHPRVNHHQAFTFEVAEQDATTGERRKSGLLTGCAYNLSRSGIQFLCGTNLAQAQIVLRLTLPGRGLTCLKAEVVHVREVIDGLWECGAAFQQQLGDDDVREVLFEADEFLLPTDPPVSP